MADEVHHDAVGYEGPDAVSHITHTGLTQAMVKYLELGTMKTKNISITTDHMTILRVFQCDGQVIRIG